MNELDSRLALEKEYHESEDFLRDQSSLIVGVYQSGVFEGAESYHLDILGDISGANVLDYGCGTGGSMRQLRERGANVTGFDISLLRLQVANEKMMSLANPQKAKITQCAAERLPFKDQTFDHVIGKQILHHLDIDLAIEEIRRVLKPNGTAAFLEPLIHNPLLEGYRRLTPNLRSPTEKALSLKDLERIGNNFSRWEHKEFCLFSVLPALAAAVTQPSPAWTRLQHQLQNFDRWLVDTFPLMGRYYWETVILLQR